MITCPICESERLDDLGDLQLCLSCGHLFQFPPTTSVAYDASYLRTYDEYPTREMSYLRIGFLCAFVSGGRLLDVGYGKGDFIRTAEAAGFSAFGSDVHGVACGVEEVDIGADESHWDVATFFDSLEHFPDFVAVRRLLVRTRHVLVSVPMLPPSFPAVREWRHYKPGEHLHYFTPQSLRLLVGKPLLRRSHVEDAIRGRTCDQPNIYTAIFGPADEV